MKRTPFIGFIVLLISLFYSSNIYSTCAPLTVSMAGGTNNATGFTADSQVGIDGSATYYVTWDATYVYFGWSGGRTNYSSDMYYVAIDVDPGSGNGTSTAIEGASFSESVMDYYVVYENNASFYGAPVSNGNAFELYQNNAGAWNFVSRTGGDDGVSSQIVFSDGPGEVRLRILWTDLGFTPGAGNDIRFVMWTNNSSGNLVWSSLPSDNPTGATPQTLTHGFTFSTTADGTCPAAEASEAPLPVEFGGISASVREEIISIDWYTEIEVNNSHFEIEKSEDLRNWTYLGRKTGQIYTSERTYYNFEDQEPMEGVNYYRIKQVDRDGRFSYSEIVSAEIKKSNVKLYPNPVANQVNIEFGKLANGKLLIYDVNGRLIMREVYNDIEFIEVDLNQLGSGLFLVRIEDENGRIIQSQRLMKL